MSPASKHAGLTISTAAAEHPALDYEALRQEGIALLQRLSGQTWTDHNAHDPGITILEQLCYAITDLGYRISHSLPDLLSEPVPRGAQPFPHLFTPAQILTSAPVTLTDLRKIVLDVEGVQNAWIKPIAEPKPALYYHEGRRELSLRADDETAERVHLRGLYRVSIERSELSWQGGAQVEEAVAKRLHRHRNLCEDFAQVVVLDPQDTRVHAAIEIDAVEDSAALLVQIYQAIATYMSPTIRFATLAEMLASGRTIDEIYDGPLLEHGFIDSDALEALKRRELLYTSDLIQVITDIPGVRAIRQISVSLDDEPPAPWSVELREDRVPRLRLTASAAKPQELSIKLLRDRMPIEVDKPAVMQGYRAWQNERARRPKPDPKTHDELLPAAGRDRALDRYTSVQHHFPAAYGIGSPGLPASASAERKAHAQQLRAYLTIFDQLLANGFSQLAHVRHLFALQGSSTSYFSQPVDDPTIPMSEVWRGDPPSPQKIQDMVEETFSEEHSLPRRDRFLNHLLARFNEQLTDYSLLLYGATRGSGVEGEQGGLDTTALRARLAEDKARFLRGYPRISSDRGAALDVLVPESADNGSGLGERLRLKLGLRSEDGEDFRVIEHILLRPMEQDRLQSSDEDGSRIPLLAATRTKDPYSLQLSVVLTEWPARLKNPGFRSFVENTVREETPAHLTVYVHWVDPDAWTSICTARERWLRLRSSRTVL